MGLNLSFISNVLLTLELTGTDTAQPFSSPMVLIILQGGSFVFANEEKGSCNMESFPYNHNTIDEI